jgi:hypothetical protein
MGETCPDKPFVTHDPRQLKITIRRICRSFGKTFKKAEIKAEMKIARARTEVGEGA